MVREDPDILVDLTTARTEFEAQTIANALEGHGLEARVFANVGSTLQWEVAASQPIRVAVRRRDLAAARSVLRAVKAESIDVDWDEIDTGDDRSLREAEVRVMMEDRCPRCGYDLAGLDPNRTCPECGVNQRAKLERIVEDASARPSVNAVAAPRRRWLWLGVFFLIVAVAGLAMGWWNSVLGGYSRSSEQINNPVGHLPTP